MVVPTTTTREVHYHGTLRPTLCGLNMSCRALVRRVSSSRPSEAISMDQPGEGKQLLPQRQYNCFCTQPSPSPSPSPSSWVPTCQFSSYFIILLLVTTTLLLVTSMRDYFYFTASVIVYYSLPPPPYAACAVPLRAPLSRSLRGGAGRLGTRPGRTRQSKLTTIHVYIRARTNWLVR